MKTSNIIGFLAIWVTLQLLTLGVYTWSKMVDCFDKQNGIVKVAEPESKPSKLFIRWFSLFLPLALFANLNNLSCQ